MNPYLLLEHSVTMMHDSLRGLGQHGASEQAKKAALRQTVVHMAAAVSAMQRIIDQEQE